MHKEDKNIVDLKAKICTSCGVNKPLSDFYLDRGKPAGRCKVCRLDASKKYVQSIPKDVFRDRRKKYAGEYGLNINYKRFYGLSLDIVKKMLEAQNGRCANTACCSEITLGGKNRATKANLDHNHETGKVRGLVCNPCNMYLGVTENKKKFLGLRDYLKKYDVVPDYIKES